MAEPLSLRVVRIERKTDHITAIRLERNDGGRLPAFTPGAHIDLHLPNGLTRQYSLVNHPSETGHYLLGVLREKAGRGGSAWVHDRLTEGMALQVGTPRNNFPLVPAERYLFIAGGIGVTPLLSMGAHLHRGGAAFHLHYCTRSASETAFLERIAQQGWRDRVTLIHDGGDPSQGLDVGCLISQHEPGTHLYCCGPSGLMQAVRDASAHWPSGTVHFEWFSADPVVTNGAKDKAFTVALARSQREFAVPAEKSIAQVLAEHAIPVETLCTEGLCGTCITDVVEGAPDHRDSILTDEERASNKLMTICCSRAKSSRLVLDL